MTPLKGDLPCLHVPVKPSIMKMIEFEHTEFVDIPCHKDNDADIPLLGELPTALRRKMKRVASTIAINSRHLGLGQKSATHTITRSVIDIGGTALQPSPSLTWRNAAYT